MKNTKKVFCAVLAVLMMSACAAFSSCSTTDSKGNGDTTVQAETETDANGNVVTEKNAENLAGNDVKNSDGNSSDKQNSDGKNTVSDGNVSTQSAKDAPQFVLSSMKSEYAAGETVTVTVSLRNAPLTACFDFYVRSEGALYNEVSTASLGDMQLAADGAEELCRIMGMVASTIDIDNSRVADITFNIPADAKSGDVITFNGATKEFQKGRDESGAKVDDVVAKMTDPVLKITVK